MTCRKQPQQEVKWNGQIKATSEVAQDRKLGPKKKWHKNSWENENFSGSEIKNKQGTKLSADDNYASSVKEESGWHFDKHWLNKLEIQYPPTLRSLESMFY